MTNELRWSVERLINEASLEQHQDNPFAKDIKRVAEFARVHIEAKGGEAGELPNKLRQHVIASDGSALYPGGLDGTRELILSAADALTVQQSELAALKGGDVGELAAFGASEAACIYYPGEDQELLRDAYCRGAGHAASALATKDAEIERLLQGLNTIKEYWREASEEVGPVSCEWEKGNRNTGRYMHEVIDAALGKEE